MLFVPFLELKMKQNIKQVKDNNIGMGLACSEAISSALNGDIKISQSQRGLTVFAFKIPVKVDEKKDKLHTCKDYSFEPNLLKNAKFSDDIKEFLKKRKIKGIRKFDFELLNESQ